MSLVLRLSEYTDVGGRKEVSWQPNEKSQLPPALMQLIYGQLNLPLKTSAERGTTTKKGGVELAREES